MIKYRQDNGYDVKAASDEAAYVETMPSLTVQSQADEADINVMMKRFGVTGKFPENLRVPQFGDYSHITDFASAWKVIQDAASEFMTLPAEVRSRFENNPQLFLEFVEDGRNLDELRKMGLAKPLPASSEAPGAAIAGGGAVQGTPPSGSAPAGSSS